MTATTTLVQGGTATSRALVQRLVAHGVERIYCCPGSTEAAFLDALVTDDEIELVLVTQESIAISMAEGEARRTGRPAVAYLHTHVGMANGLAHLTSARLAHAPVIVLNGLKHSSLPGRGGFTTVPDPAEVVRQYVGWAQVSVSAQAVAEDVDRAIHHALTEPAGPVWLGLPQDLLEVDQPIAEPGPARTGTPDGPAPTVALEAAAGLLGDARRPVVVVGGDAVRRRAAEAAIELAHRIGAVLLDEGRRDLLATGVPTATPGYAGLYDVAHPAVRAADVVLFAGCRLFTEFEAPAPGGDLPVQARLIHLHSDPSEIGRLHPVDVALAGDPAASLAALLAAVPAHGTAAPAAEEPAGGPPTPPAGMPGHTRLRPFLELLATAVEEVDATVVLDATTASVPALRALRTSRPGQVIGSTSGSLGWGVGAALGVRLAEPERPVLCLLGDGGLQFGIPGLWTARRYGIAVTYAVLDNGAYGAVASALSRFGGAAVAEDSWPGTDIAGLDIAALARSFGLDGRRVADPAHLLDPLLAALRGSTPTLFDLDTAPGRE
jgi:benzoylformate decarboxylase